MRVLARARHAYALGSRARRAVEAARLGDRAAADEQGVAVLRAIVSEADPAGDRTR